MPALKERAKTLAELVIGALFLVADTPLKLDDKAAKLIDADARTTLAALLKKFESNTAWSAEALEAEVRAYSEETGAKLGKVAQPLRAALTGRSVSPPVFTVLEVLGREESLKRIKACAG
jgi:glutamyl-tRNA synthetase